MKLSKTLIASSVAAVMAAGFMAPAQAEVEVGASVGVANMYLWRGYNLGDSDAGLGTPAVSGDLNVSASGFYGGIWGSSGDAAAGTEYDLYVGYGASFGDFSVDVSAWTYVYPQGPGYVEDNDEIGKLSDAVLSLGYGPVALTYYDNIAGASGYWYTTLGLELAAFSFTYGLHEDDYAHLDVGYAFNDNLSFTLSAVVDDVDGAQDDSTKFVVSYSLPLGE